MITLAELRARMERLWGGGRVLRAELGEEPLFPLEIPVTPPSPARWLDYFAQIRGELAELEANSRAQLGHGYELFMHEVEHRQLGRQQLPKRIVFPDIEQFARFMGRHADLLHFRRLVAGLLESQPKLRRWCADHPLRVLEFDDRWPQLLAVVAYFQAHPRPGVYERELDIPRVHTKFIDWNRSLVRECLDACLPGELIDPRAGIGFESRYGLRQKPDVVRLRLLDPALSPGWGLRDIAMPWQDFRHLDLAPRRVFVTENETNFLAFPDQPGALVIWGRGVAAGVLGKARWLHPCDVHYWGDLDTDGFSILSRLRAGLPNVRSLLMDAATLIEHRELWGKETSPNRLALTERLHDDERALYRDLLQERYGERLRLEQEHIRFGWLKQRLAGLDRPRQ